MAKRNTTASQRLFAESDEEELSGARANHGSFRELSPVCHDESIIIFNMTGLVYQSCVLVGLRGLWRAMNGDFMV